jgi:hypothetical protein
MPTTKTWRDEMNVVAAETQRLIRAARKTGLSNDATCLAVLIGVLSVIRVDGLREDQLWREAQTSVPRKIDS